MSNDPTASGRGFGCSATAAIAKLGISRDGPPWVCVGSFSIDPRGRPIMDDSGTLEDWLTCTERSCERFELPGRPAPTLFNVTACALEEEVSPRDSAQWMPDDLRDEDALALAETVMISLGLDTPAGDPGHSHFDTVLTTEEGRCDISADLPV